MRNYAHLYAPMNASSATMASSAIMNAIRRHWMMLRVTVVELSAKENKFIHERKDMWSGRQQT